MNAREVQDRDDGKPKPIVNAVANPIATLRADDDQLTLAKARESLDPKAIEKLEVDDAHRQPTVANAVKACRSSAAAPTRKC